MMFEHISILKGNLNKREIEDEIRKYKEYFKNNNISLESFENKGLQEIAYKVGDNDKGIFLFYEIWSEESKISDLEGFAREDKNVLKFMTVSSKSKRVEKSEIIDKISSSNESFLFKGIADYVVAHLENLNEDGRNIDFNINDVKEITEDILNDDYFYNSFINTISDTIDEKFPKQENERESEEEI